MQTIQLQIDRDRLMAELETLASFSDDTPPGISRLVFADADQSSRAWLKGQCEAAGLIVREDAVGNMFARWTGARPELPAIGTGSHIDAIPHSGKFDGTVGVLGGLEAIRALQQSGFRPQRSIELLLFTSEEPTRFGLGCLGSRMLSGGLDSSADTRLKDSEGNTLAQLRAAAGFDGPLDQVRLADGYYGGFVELHIEQGPLLEKEGLPIGVVTSIAAPAALRITVEGEGGHAGGVLMPDRKDAFCAAAEIVLTIEERAKATGSIDSCATVGKCVIYPGAVNSIPSRVEMDADIRDTDEQRRNRVLREIEQACAHIAARRKVQVRVSPINADAPATCSPRTIEAAAAAATDNGLPFKKMVSRAYHDSLFMSRIAPVGMIFIPCRGGVSHRPDEYSSPQEIENGVRVLAGTLSRLSSFGG
ncbi:MAG: M20 family metallo-hydrolase [Acidobacteriaceae bacterium]